MNIFIDEGETTLSVEERYEFKNLRELAAKLGLKYSDSTNGRKALLKTANQYFELERRGNKYIVLKVYKEKRLREDKRCQRKSKYGDDLFCVLNHIIGDKLRYLTAWEIALCLINKEVYNDCLFNFKYLNEKLDLDFNQEQIDYLILLLRESANSILKPSLRSLERLQMIECEEVWVGIIDFNEKIWLTNEEVDIYKDARESISKEYGVDFRKLIFNRKMYHVFSKKASDRSGLGYESIYKSYAIKIKKDYEVKCEKDFYSSLSKIKSHMIKKTLENLDKKHRKFLKEDFLDLKDWERNACSISKDGAERILFAL